MTCSAEHYNSAYRKCPECGALTVHGRAASYAERFPEYPPLQEATEGGLPVLYGQWLGGADYRATGKLYGAYPRGYLARVAALFPDVEAETRNMAAAYEMTPDAPAPHWPMLHVFSGGLEWGDYVRLDLHPGRGADVTGSVYDAPALFADRQPFSLVLADPPYSAEDAKRYETPMVNRGRVMRSLWPIVRPGGHVVWLDTVWPMFRRQQWRTVGRIMYTRSTNNRLRGVSIFERQP